MDDEYKIKVKGFLAPYKITHKMISYWKFGIEFIFHYNQDYDKNYIVRHKMLSDDQS